MMTPAICHEHNKVTRTDVTFHWFMYHEALSKTRTVDLYCRCRVHDQLKTVFCEVASMDPYSSCDISFSAISLGGSLVLSDGYAIYDTIMPEVSIYHSHPQLDLCVQMVEVPAMEKMASLERSIKECNKTIKSDKNWRLLKDTEIAEEQLSIREMFEKQQKEIKALQDEVNDLKLSHNSFLEPKIAPSNQIKEEYVDDENLPIQHKGVICDGCDDSIFGHRFKCAICFDYDLCYNCEALGCHAFHAMIRIVSPQHTEVPPHILPEYRRKLEEQHPLKESPNRCDCKVNIRPNAKKGGILKKPKESVPSENAAAQISLINDHQAILKELLPEITIVPPVGQTTPFNPSDFSMKLVNPSQVYQPVLTEQILEEIERRKKETTQEKPAQYRKLMTYVEPIDWEKEIRKIEEELKLKELPLPSFLRKKKEELEEENMKKETSEAKVEENDTEEKNGVEKTMEASTDSSDSALSSTPSSMSFATLSEALRDIQEYDKSSQQEEHDSTEEYEIIDDEEALHTAVLPTPENRD